MPNGALFQLSSGAVHDAVFQAPLGTSGTTSPFQSAVAGTHLVAPFAVELVRALDFRGADGLVPGERVIVGIPRLGDLLWHITLTCTLTRPVERANEPALYAGEAAVRRAEFRLGATSIETLYGPWLRARAELMQRPLDPAISRTTSLEVGQVSKEIAIQLPFFFSGNDPSTALPLLAIQRMAAELEIELEDGELPGGCRIAANSAQLWLEYCQLGNEQRRDIVNKRHAIPIRVARSVRHRIELSSSRETQRTVDLASEFAGPVEFVAWAAASSLPSRHGAFSLSLLAGERNEDVYGTITSTRFDLNGLPLLPDATPPLVLNALLPLIRSGNVRASPSAGLYMYSFALDITAKDFNGSCNFSSITDKRLHVTFRQAPTSLAATALDTFWVFGVTHNVLQISEGFASLAWL